MMEVKRMNNQTTNQSNSGQGNTTPQNARRKYIVLDIVFYGSSLNYDQGTGNYQELKKITKWDGKQYVLVSRYALRYSILHWANKIFPDWKLAGNDVLIAESQGVARLRKPEELNGQSFKSVFETYPEFDLFGFMTAPKGRKEAALTRVSPVKISHAISMTPYSYDSHFTANLDVMKRAAGSGSNPVTIEEKKDFYVYNIVIDVDRIGKYTKDEHGNDAIGDINVSDKCEVRIKQLVETLFSLKREIKGRMEDLSPWLVICGLYTDGKYETYLDKIELAKSHVYKIITKEKTTQDSEGKTVKEVEHETVERSAPKFVIDIDQDVPKLLKTKEDIVKKIENFLDNKEVTGVIVYKRNFVEIEPQLKFIEDKNAKKDGTLQQTETK
jgi:CRISPR-associated protein Cst2